MVVQHNLRAMNSNRMLGITTGQLSKSSEKLSSGYKVNRAADDAAGLSISEKMRKQIRGLTQASANAEDGISSVQTAEGALTEVHDMLQRMNELANKASNGTNSISDRQTIQDEVDQLLTEIDRVAETTKFNETYLLKGNTAGTSSEIKVNSHDAGIAGKLVDKGGKTATFALEKALEDGDKINIAGTEYTIGSSASGVTASYVQYTAAGIGATTMEQGDSITYEDANGLEHTSVMVGKVKNDAAGALANNGTEFIITDESGHEQKYTIAAADNNTDPKNLAVTKANAELLIQEAFKNGHDVKMTKYSADATGNNITDVNWEVVKKLEDDEIGGDVWLDKSFDDLVQDTAHTGIAGAAYTASDLRSASLANFSADEVGLSAEKPMTIDEVSKIINELQNGDKIQLTANGTTDVKVVEIADKTEVTGTSNKVTIEDALKLINRDAEFDTIQFAVAATSAKALQMMGKYGVSNDSTPGAAPAWDGTKATVVGNTSESGAAASNMISAKTAYEKIADALQQASSIGTDDGKEASVKNNKDGSFTITKGSTVVKDTLAFNLHVGADADMTNKINVKIDTMSTKGLGIQKLDVIGRNPEGEKIDDGGMAATYAIDAISDAIAKVSAQRSLLGAVQNRLEHTINNLDNVVENTTSAESAIRDTDMATEMVKYANNNILQQAGQSMLAQANQGNQGVLSLLG